MDRLTCGVGQMGGEMSNVKAEGLSMHLRDYVEPLFVIAQVRVACLQDAPQADTKDQGHGGVAAHEDTDWLPRGCLLMSEEHLPHGHHSLMLPVVQELHPAAPGVVLMRSPAGSKIWAHLDVVLDQAVVCQAPSLGPAINIVSMVVAGLSPPTSETVGGAAPTMMSWDKARLMMHGKVRLHMQDARLRLLGGSSPYSNAECLQLDGKSVKMFYKTKDPSASSLLDPLPSVLDPLGSSGPNKTTHPLSAPNKTKHSLPSTASSHQAHASNSTVHSADSGHKVRHDVLG